MKVNYTKFIVLKSDSLGVIPTVPTVSNHKQAGWNPKTDIYEGELFLNTTDEILYTRAGSTILQISGASASAGATSIGGGVLSADGILNAVYQDGCLAGGTQSAAFGFGTTASGAYAFAEGWLTLASGTASHSEGYRTTASGEYSHASGKYNIASGYASAVGGSGNNVSHECSVILGGRGLTSSAIDTVYAPRFEAGYTGEGIIMASPDGTRYKLTITNDGAVDVTAV